MSSKASEAQPKLVARGALPQKYFSHKEAQKAQKDFIDFCAFCASLWQMISFFVAESVRGRHS
ncbi:MAG TPA: hypothetical protein VFH46_00870, partial [Pyrinomonadaceae bacterium]|nr:hypothetical protein [Pyrinomonadaceae bacterium]